MATDNYLKRTHVREGLGLAPREEGEEEEKDFVLFSTGISLFCGAFVFGCLQMNGHVASRPPLEMLFVYLIKGLVLMLEKVEKKER